MANAAIVSATGLLRQYGVGTMPINELATSLDLGRVVGILGVALASVTELAGTLVFLFSLLLFLSIESGGFRAKRDVLARARPLTALALTRFVLGTRRFLVVTTVFGLITAVVDTVALLLLGVPLAVLWGLLAFITNYIPYIGFVIGVVPPALLALLEGGWPRLLRVGLSLTVVFLSLGFWAWILGPVGAVLAVPLTLLVKALLVDADPRAQWVSTLFAARPDPPPPTSSDSRTR